MDLVGVLEYTLFVTIGAGIEMAFVKKSLKSADPQACGRMHTTQWLASYKDVDI